LRVCYPVVPQADGGDCEVLIHSKLLIIDDDFLRVGSSNLNNRSAGLDTECDLAIEALDDVQRSAIARLRNELLGEHLGVPAELVAQTASEDRSLVETVDYLNRNARGLRSFKAVSSAGPRKPILGTSLLDPVRPFQPFSFLRRRRRPGLHI
jgi:phosphatidylserine/phosphatidylglycerophosphate/cardiolipin synthase-like enzyme